MATRSFQPNTDGFRAIANGPEIRRALAAEMERGKAFAESISQDFQDSGEYARSFEVSDETIAWAGQYPGPRAAGVLRNNAPYSAAVEFGSGGPHQHGTNAHPTASAHRVLGRTLDFLAGDE